MDSEGSDDSDDSSSHFIVHEDDLFRVDEDADLASHFLRNMFVTAYPSAARKAPRRDTAPELYDSKAVDWDF